MTTANNGTIKPPFTGATARAKVRATEDAWNTRRPELVVRACSADSQWRNRDEFFTGRAAIREFLTAKWQKELHYRLKKELWAFSDDRVSVCFVYEWQHSATGHWYRTHGNEHWQFDIDGLMAHCDMSANDTPISAAERQLGVPSESLASTA